MVNFWGNLVFSVKVQSEFFGFCGGIRWGLVILKEVHELLEYVGM